jgi:Leucine-rich repeat (LRR) protein
LRSLDLSRTQVSGKGIGELAALEKLQRLSLWHAGNIQDDVAGGLATLRNLEVLDLSDTKIADATLGALDALPALRHIYLAGTAVTADGVKAFQRTHRQCEVSWK